MYSKFSLVTLGIVNEWREIDRLSILLIKYNNIITSCTAQSQFYSK